MLRMQLTHPLHAEVVKNHFLKNIVGVLDGKPVGRSRIQNESFSIRLDEDECLIHFRKHSHSSAISFWKEKVNLFGFQTHVHSSKGVENEEIHPFYSPRMGEEEYPKELFDEIFETVNSLLPETLKLEYPLHKVKVAEERA